MEMCCLTIPQFGRSSWLLPASILSEEIERAYRDKGFWAVVVHSQEEKDRSFFLINEGPRAVIRAIEIKHANYLDQAFLIKRCFVSVLKRAYYEAPVLEASLDKLRAMYLQEGFLAMTIVDYAFEPRERPNCNR